MKIATQMALGLAALLTMVCGVSCSSGGDTPSVPAVIPDKALVVVNAGNYGAGNSTLSLYNPESNECHNELFYGLNGYRLGDQAQSMTRRNNVGWVTVANSHIIFALDLDTMRERGRITGIHAPRYICFVSDEKAYVSQLWSDHLTIINPKTYAITGTVSIPNMVAESGSTEEMVYRNGYLYVCCWSYHKRVVKIDTATDRVVAEVEAGIQPTSLVEDRNHHLWTLCDGGYEGAPVGYDAPTLSRINPQTMQVEATFRFTKGDYLSKLRINKAGSHLYWLNNGSLYRMAIDAPALPAEPLVAGSGYLNALTIDPEREEIYVADAIDYQQQGIIYRYSATGKLIDSFYAGVIPTEFCWR